MDATHTAPTQGVIDWLNLIKSEYREMPGLKLTKPQMQRLWGLEGALCEALVDALEAACVLRRMSCGSYVVRDARH